VGGGYVRWNFFTDATVEVGGEVWGQGRAGGQALIFRSRRPDYPAARARSASNKPSTSSDPWIGVHRATAQ